MGRAASDSGFVRRAMRPDLKIRVHRFGTACTAPFERKTMTLYGIVGAGGFGMDVMPLARHWLTTGDVDKSNSELVFVVENNYPISQKIINNHRVLSMDEFLSATASRRRFNVAISDSKVRQRIVNSIPTNIAQPFSIFAPNHVSLDGHSVKEGAILCNFTHIGSNAKIGRFFHGNIYSSVAHDCVIGDFVTFATGARCLGRSVVEDHVYVGAGALIKDGSDKPVVIGYGARLGMGAVVTKSVPPGATVVGNPARLHTPRQ
jgi:sugar O-acyltransferase (sialic acid O-acetyltransferase NeuD family)